VGNYRHLKLNEDGQKRVERVQELFETLDRELMCMLLRGRETSLVTTHLETACMWAKKALSLQEENQIGGDLVHHTGPRTQVEAVMDKIGDDMMAEIKKPLPDEPLTIMSLSQQIQLPPVGTGNNSSGMSVNVRLCICGADTDVQGWHTPSCEEANDRHKQERKERGEYGPNHR
jgi:hypothetical protein